MIDFLGFSPSTIAAAAVLCAAGERINFAAAAEGDQATALFHDIVNKVIIHPWACEQILDFVGVVFTNNLSF